jgi:hypothetical protein
MDESNIIHNRRSGRSPVLLSAKIEVEGRDVPVVLRNLSSEGALLESASLPPEGAMTMFTRNDLSVEGRIIWVEGRFAGLAFDRRLEREEMLRHVPQPRQRIEPKLRRPGLACRPLTENERKMVQTWMTAVPTLGD